MHRDDFNAHLALCETQSRFRLPVRISYRPQRRPSTLARVLRALFRRF
jgi:hypothetical protein